MPGYTYTTFVAALAVETAIPTTDPNFVAILPSAIDYAEGRIYRELDLLSTVVRDTSATLTANSRDFTLPSSLGRFVVTNGINVFTPAGTTTLRNPLVPVSLDYINVAWPTETAASVSTVPACYAMVTDQAIVVGPPPGAAFTVEVIGTIRPTPLSAANPTTWLSQYLPDLLFAAAMVFMAGYMRNFGAQADDPKMAQSWEAQYQTLKSSAAVEEFRKKYESSGWASLSPAAIATPGR